MSAEHPPVDFGALGADRLEEYFADVRNDSTPTEEFLRSVEEVRAEGNAGGVHAVMKADGTLAELTVDPRLLRAGSEAVADAVLEAVNAAATGARAQLGELLNDDRMRRATQLSEELTGDFARVLDQVLTNVARVQSRLR